MTTLLEKARALEKASSRPSKVPDMEILSLALAVLRGDITLSNANRAMGYKSAGVTIYSRLWVTLQRAFRMGLVAITETGATTPSKASPKSKSPKKRAAKKKRNTTAGKYGPRSTRKDGRPRKPKGPHYWVEPFTREGVKIPGHWRACPKRKRKHKTKAAASSPGPRGGETLRPRSRTEAQLDRERKQRRNKMLERARRDGAPPCPGPGYTWIPAVKITSGGDTKIRAKGYWRQEPTYGASLQERREMGRRRFGREAG